MTVNLSTRLFYDRSASAMTSLSAQADRLNTQISSTKKFQAPSDDSVAYQRLQGLARAGANDTAYAANVGVARESLTQADTALSSIVTEVQRASELAIQANSGTQNAGGREAIAVALQGVLANIVSLANGTDARGVQLFGGAGDDKAVTLGAGGALTFAAGNPAAIPVADGDSVATGANAATFLKVGGASGAKDIGSVITALVTALRGTGDIADAATDAIGDLSTIDQQSTTAQASVGARGARLELLSGQLQMAQTSREETRSGIEDTDVSATYLQLQKTMTVLSATQASFSKLQGLSLFDYLR